MWMCLISQPSGPSYWFGNVVFFLVDIVAVAALFAGISSGETPFALMIGYSLTLLGGIVVLVSGLGSCTQSVGRKRRGSNGESLLESPGSIPSKGLLSDSNKDAVEQPRGSSQDSGSQS